MPGKRIGYVRVSTVDQNPERQLEGVEVDKTFLDYASGSSKNRPQLIAMIEYMREDDIVFVHSLDRLARNLKDLLELIELFEKKNVEIRFLKENLSFNGDKNALSKLHLGIIGAVAEFERALNLERQREGIELAKKKGRYRGRATKYNKNVATYISEMLKTTRKSKNEIAEDLKISRVSLYRYIQLMQKEGLL